MSFAFTAPLALGLGALIGLPILAHLTRQRPTDRVAYGAMLLVRRLVKRLRRRRSLKDRWLLLLRVLAALLAVLAAAGPRLSWTGAVPNFEGSGREVIVLDHSLSMALHDGGGTLLEQAKAAAGARVQAAPDGVRFGLVAYAGSSRPLTPELTTDKARVLSLIETIEPTLFAGDLRGALLDARKLLEGEPGEVVLFSDEAGPTMIPDAEEELGRLVSSGSVVVPQPVLAEPPRNLTLSSAEYGDGLEGGQVRFRVRNFGPTPVEAPCAVLLPDGAEISVFVEIPAEGEAEANVTVPREARAGVGQVSCEDPDLPLDDRRWFHLPQVGASRVLVVDGDPGDTPTQSEVYFLERALAPWGGAQSGVAIDVVTTQGLDILSSGRHRLVFLANVADPRPIAGALREHVRNGGALVIGMGDNVTADRYETALGSILPARLRRVEAVADRGELPVTLGPIDTSASLFLPFRRGGLASLGRVGAWRVMTLEPYTDGGDVHTLLRYDGGMPALVERTLGQGAVLLWTSSFDDGWSNLPFQAAFMPLVQRMVALYGGDAGGRALRVATMVGGLAEVDLPEGIPQVDVTGPTGEAARFERTGDRITLHPEVPGAYSVRVPDGPVLAWIAVNLDPEESDVRHTHSVAATEAELSPELFTSHQELGGPALALALALMALSALVALRPGETS